jgi:predicted DNA-binding transcriptional regulator AlpA
MVVTREETPNGMVKRIVINGHLNQAPAKKAEAKKVKPQAPEISLSQPGRLRVANVMSLFGISRSTLYSGVNSGRYPQPDGKDGRLPYWNTETLRRWLKEGK